MTEQSSSSNPTYDDDFSTNPVDPNPPSLDFITGLNVQQQALIKSIWNSDALTFNEKIACIDGELRDNIAKETRERIFDGLLDWNSLSYDLEERDKIRRMAKFLEQDRLTLEAVGQDIRNIDGLLQRDRLIHESEERNRRIVDRLSEQDRLIHEFEERNRRLFAGLGLSDEFEKFCRSFDSSDSSVEDAYDPNYFTSSSSANSSAISSNTAQSSRALPASYATAVSARRESQPIDIGGGSRGGAAGLSSSPSAMNLSNHLQSKIRIPLLIDLSIRDVNSSVSNTNLENKIQQSPSSVISNSKAKPINQISRETPTRQKDRSFNNNRTLFFLRDDNKDGYACLYDSLKHRVEKIEKFSGLPFPFEIAVGNDKIFMMCTIGNNIFEIFDLEERKMTRGIDPPEWRRYSSIAYYNNKLFYIGGEDSNSVSVKLTNRVDILENGVWKRGPDFPKSITQSQYAICNGRLYIINSTKIFRFLDGENGWIEEGNWKEYRGNCAAVSLGGKIYIVGGYDPPNILNSCFCFDPRKSTGNRIHKIANMNYKRCHHSLVVANEKIYTIGGYQQRKSEGGYCEYCKSIEEYDPVTDTWRISNNTLLNIKSLSINDTKPSDIPSHNENKTIVATPNYRQNKKVLFYLLYGGFPNYEGRICHFNSRTFEVEIVKKFSTWANPCEVTIGDDKIFLINGSKKVFEIFNCGTKQLTKGPDPPEWRSLANVAYYKNKLYYIGGYGFNCRSFTHVNILVNGKWQRGPDFPINISLANHVICNDKLYIISFDAVFQLSDNEREWIEVGTMETRREGPAVASFNGKVYITGGHDSEILNSCLCFDPNQPFDRRFSIANMNYEGHDHSLVVANGKMYAIGGYQESPFIKFCKSIEEYDPVTDTWRIVKKPEKTNEELAAELEEVKRTALQEKCKMDAEQKRLRDELDEERRKKDDLLTCCICFTNKSCIVFQPCGHLVTCEECSGNESLLNCPVCRGNITQRIKAFL